MRYIPRAPCFLCQRPSDQAVLCIDPLDQSEQTVHTCNSCFWTCCSGNDQLVAQLWSAIKEGESSGYTEAGFVHNLINALKEFSGYAFLSLVTTKASNQPLDQAFLCVAALHPHFPNSWIVTRSKNPVFPLLEKVAMKTLEVKTIPDGVAFYGRTFVIQNKVLMTDQDKVKALVSSFEHFTGTHDIFQLLAYKETSAGFEVIRRHLIG